MIPLFSALSVSNRNGKRRRNWGPYLWVLPALTMYAIFKLVPMFAGLYLAMLRWDGIERA